ncbi:hypothetical protein SPB21_20400 [Leptothoe sp. ISB3NOV94-8A]
MRIPFTFAPQVGAASLLSIGLLALGGDASEAACLPGRCSQNGLIFSEASANFRITNVTGRGTHNNPFVVYQDVWGLDISLAVSNLPNAPQHSVFNRPGFAISIVSRNLTGAFWRFYDHELQETAGYASGENDGLSFAQAIGPVRPYTSSHYQRADEITDVRDFINFYRGNGVNPGETGRFNYFITDTIPNQRFYIRQRPDYRTNATQTPVISPQRPKTQPTNPRPIKAPQPILKRPQPVTPAPVIPAPVTPAPAVPPQPGVSPPKVLAPQAQPVTLPQAVPEPSTVIMGVLALLFSKSIDQRKSPN